MKTIKREKTVKELLLHRYKIANGHLNKVIKMIESDRYCLDVVHQSLAVQAALKAADRKLLENHLNTCVSDSIKKGESKEAIAEIMDVLNKI